MGMDYFAALGNARQYVSEAASFGVGDVGDRLLEDTAQYLTATALDENLINANGPYSSPDTQEALEIAWELMERAAPVWLTQQIV